MGDGSFAILSNNIIKVSLLRKKEFTFSEKILIYLFSISSALPRGGQCKEENQRKKKKKSMMNPSLGWNKPHKKSSQKQEQQHQRRLQLFVGCVRCLVWFFFHFFSSFHPVQAAVQCLWMFLFLCCHHCTLLTKIISNFKWLVVSPSRYFSSSSIFPPPPPRELRIRAFGS